MLLVSMDRVRNMFHVSLLRKFIKDPSYVLRVEEIDLSEDLSYKELPIQILDKKSKGTKNKQIPLVKVLWRNHQIEKAT